MFLHNPSNIPSLKGLPRRHFANPMNIDSYCTENILLTALYRKLLIIHRWIIRLYITWRIPTDILDLFWIYTPINRVIELTCLTISEYLVLLS